MQRRSSPLARVLAVAAIATAAIVLIVVFAATLGDGGGGSNAPSEPSTSLHAHQHQHRTTAANYEVKSGDTLISIAHRTGVPVWKIEELNPEVDPQILIAGEKLKLR